MLAIIRNGASPPRAAQLIGVSRATYYRWMKEGARSRAPAHLRRFHDDVEQARAVWICKVSLAVTEGLKRDPALAIKILRRVDPDGGWDIEV